MAPLIKADINGSSTDYQLTSNTETRNIILTKSVNSQSKDREYHISCKEWQFGNPFPVEHIFSSVTVENTNQSYTIYSINNNNTDWFFLDFEVIAYIKVSYNLGGGTAGYGGLNGSSTESHYPDNSSFILASNITKSGYYFVGFEGPFIGYPSLGETVKINVRGGTEITAHWVKYRSYSFELSGGTQTAGSSSSTVLKYGTSVTLPTANKNGYEFINYTNDVNTSTENTMGATKSITTDIKYTLNWRINKYTVTYLSTTPSYFNFTSSSGRYDFNTPLTATIINIDPPRVIGEVYSFDKWTYNYNDLGTTRLPSRNINLHANWNSSNKHEIQMNELSIVFDNSNSYQNIKISNYFDQLQLYYPSDKKNVKFSTKLKGQGTF